MKTHTQLSITLVALTISSVLAIPTFAATSKLVDVDGDGVISAEEIRSAREQRKLENLSLYDKDGNGELSRMERRAMKDARYNEMLPLFDSDGDGELSREERRAARDARKAEMEAQLDVNQDGVVSDEERAGLDEILAERGEKRKHGKQKRI